MVKSKRASSVYVIELCLCNFYFVFLLGFLLGLASSVIMMFSFGPSNMIKNPISSRVKPEQTKADVKLKVDAKFIREISSANLTLARQLKYAANKMQGIQMAKKMRILCWAMTANHTHKTRALAIKRTWGRHCDKLLFFSEAEDSEVPTIKIDKVPPARSGLWTKVVGAYKHVYNYHRNDYDWVLRVDDDSFAIVENMREMLLPYDPDKPGFFGYRFIPHSPRGYFSGGGGVITSREAVKRVVTQAFDDKSPACANTSIPLTDDDVKIGQCLYAVGIEPDDSRDFLGRSRMHCFDDQSHVNPNIGKRDWWYWNYLWWPVQGGLKCCAENGIAWHYIAPEKQYMLYYLAYHVQPESVIFVAKATPPPGGIPKVTRKTTFEPLGHPIEIAK